MSGKSKFQISKKLNGLIQAIVDKAPGLNDITIELKKAYIVGFHCSNVTNYVGLVTKCVANHHVDLPIVGLVYFKGQPLLDELGESIKQINDNNATSGVGSFSTDKNNGIFLVYYLDENTNQMAKKLFDVKSGDFMAEQPKLSVLDESKIMAHSPLVSVDIKLRLRICDKSGKILATDKTTSELEKVKSLLASDDTEVRLHLDKSNFSSSSIRKNTNLTESLYDCLDPPADIAGAGDYLPQVSKAERQKLVEKWRNKVKSQRIPLAFKLELEHLSYGEHTSLSPEDYGLDLRVYLNISVNDPLSKSFKLILHSIKQRLSMLAQLLLIRPSIPLEKDELKFCTFRVADLGYLVGCVYDVPVKRQPDFQRLAEIRKQVHDYHLLSLDRPAVRYSQRLTNLAGNNVDEDKGYLCNVHLGVAENSGIKNGLRNVLEGTYTYHHYLQDRASDSGWGCAYRSLQTIISWFQHQGYICSADVQLRVPELAKGASTDKTTELRDELNASARVPSHEEIQRVLVDVGDKQPSFVGSSKWIGSQEVCYVLSHLYNIESKFISVSSGSELIYKVRDLGHHFASQSTPVMIGGGVLAHTIIGVDFEEKSGDARYLILDPHYTGKEDLPSITKGGWCGWKKPDFWDKNAFYNLCLPQRPIEF